MESRSLEQELLHNSLFLLSGGGKVVRVDELYGVEISRVNKRVELFSVEISRVNKGVQLLSNGIQLVCFERGSMHH